LIGAKLFVGLQHCHEQGILHQDIKGSNLLIDYPDMLKIGDFGLANYGAGCRQPLTSRVVTLWYRTPVLLLNSTSYSVGFDLWSVGCLNEIFFGKPLMPGSGEMYQLLKIFKLCGSPPDMVELQQHINNGHAVLVLGAHRVFEELSSHVIATCNNGVGSTMQDLAHAIGNTEVRPIPWPSFSFSPIGLAPLLALESIAVVGGRCMLQKSAKFKIIYRLSSVLAWFVGSGDQELRWLSSYLFIHYGNSWKLVVYDGQGHILVTMLSSISIREVGSFRCVLKFIWVPILVVGVLDFMMVLSIILQQCDTKSSRRVEKREISKITDATIMLLEEMKAHGIKLKGETYHCLLNALATTRQTDQAYVVFSGTSVAGLVHRDSVQFRPIPWFFFRLCSEVGYRSYNWTERISEPTEQLMMVLSSLAWSSTQTVTTLKL
jgi:serine/threonine protein kinase